jgi:hypothetical protein
MKWELALPTHTNDGRHAVNIQETVSPEDTGDPGRVERTRSGCHEYFGKVGHICVVDLPEFSRECEGYGLLGWVLDEEVTWTYLQLIGSRGLRQLHFTSPRHPHARAWRQQPAFPVLALCPLSCDSRFGKLLFRPRPCGSRAGAKPQKVPPLQILQRARVAGPSP